MVTFSAKLVANKWIDERICPKHLRNTLPKGAV
jgi:hypothetical protein